MRKHIETNGLTQPFNPEGPVMIMTILRLAAESDQDITFLTDSNGKHIILTSANACVKISPIPTTKCGAVWCDVTVDVPGQEKVYGTLHSSEIIEYAISPKLLAEYLRAPK